MNYESLSPEETRIYSSLVGVNLLLTQLQMQNYQSGKHEIWLAQEKLEETLHWLDKALTLRKKERFTHEQKNLKLV